MCAWVKTRKNILDQTRGFQPRIYVVFFFQQLDEKEILNQKHVYIYIRIYVYVYIYITCKDIQVLKSPSIFEFTVFPILSLSLSSYSNGLHCVI